MTGPRLPLDVAHELLGVREKTGRNDGTEVERILGGPRERGLAWCAAFVLRCFEWSDWPLHENAGEFYAWRSVTALEKACKAKGLWLPHSAQPLPHDVIFFGDRGRSDRGRGRHCGLVERVEFGRVYTIEGNLSDRVQRTDHPIFSERITGYARHPGVDLIASPVP